MRVLHLLSGDLWAGAESATYELICGLAAIGVDVRAVVLTPGLLAERLEAVGLLEAIVPEAGTAFGPLSSAVRRRVASADIVHAHGYKQDLLAALCGRPWLSTQHGRPEPARGVSRIRMAGYQACARGAQRFGAQRVVAVSTEIERWLRPRVGARKVTRSWNGISDPCGSGRTPPWRERPMRFGALCRLFPVKNLGLAIAAIAALPGVELEIVGDGPEESRLRANAEACGVRDRVLFRGFDSAPAARLSTWRALLVPSLHEGNPVSVIEALAWGTPVVAGPLPGVAEMLDGRGGWCVPSHEPTAWTQALERALDPVEGAAASLSGRARFLEAFTAHASAARMREIYVACLSGTRS